jgi:hypothetical protein
MRSVKVGSLVLLGVAGAALGQVTPTGPFTGDLQEGFQTRFDPNCVFCPFKEFFPGEIATCTAPGGGGNMHVTGSWGFICGIGGHNTPNIFASLGGGGVDWAFDPGSEAGKFGGYFGSNSPTMNGTIEFYDAGNTLLGSDVINTEPCGSWNWHGWEFSVAVAKVRVIGNYSGGGYIMHDDMEWSAFTGAPCYPDCDTSTGIGVLDIFDFLCFQNRFSSGSPYACDCDTSSGLGVCDIFDFLCFQNEFSNGCP